MGPKHKQDKVAYVKIFVVREFSGLSYAQSIVTADVLADNDRVHAVQF